MDITIHYLYLLYAIARGSGQTHVSTRPNIQSPHLKLAVSARLLHRYGARGSKEQQLQQSLESSELSSNGSASVEPRNQRAVRVLAAGCIRREVVISISFGKRLSAA